MINSGPIIFVEDDEDDVEIFSSILKELGVESTVEWFIKADDAFEFLLNTTIQPFIIICDINLPGKDGIDLKIDIDNNQVLRRKSIPFIFLSTSADKYTVERSYTEFTVQGFFKKTSDYHEMKDVFGSIIKYWSTCRHPNN